MLLPPPRMNLFADLFCSKTLVNSAVLCTATNCFALASMPKVL
jgi:hypothetical protein